MAERRRYAQVGLGARAWIYSWAIADRFAEHCRLVGLCDVNPGRLRQRIDYARSRELEVPGYPGTAYRNMIEETRPDCVVVTSPDRHHDEHICQALELGCDVITEKPMTIDAERCQRILDARERSGRRIRVAFNYRYAPHRVQVKELLASGVIGDVVSVDFHWLLDTTHGADYFRRWHRRKENSGGLLVHKATHHFDLVNWWLASVPARVFASGRRRFYTPEQAERLGLGQRGDRCLDCPEAERCPFHLDLRGRKELAAIYLEHEAHDGYQRDRCVFGRDIDIEDSVSASVEYANGVRLSYSLNAFTPWEGYTVAFNGTRGRLEHRCEETAYLSGDGTVPGALRPEGTEIRVFPHFAPAHPVPLEEVEGGHGGGDVPLMQDLFEPDPPPDPHERSADERAGAWSALTGIAANRSLDTGHPVVVASLVRGLEPTIRRDEATVRPRRSGAA